jgi:hypothetical protein
MVEALRVELTRDEALVLFDFLQRFDDQGALTIQDQAEQRALWNLRCLREKSLVEVSDPDCRVLLAGARDRLRDTKIL